MSIRGQLARGFCLMVLTLATGEAVIAQPYDAKHFAEMRWRNIGPYRGGRTRAAAGVPTQPNVFYVGVVNGGVWKTTDYGRVWKPIFDEQTSGSIGAIAVAPSDPNIIYVGSGEGLQRPDLSTGDGIYKSTDAGITWTHLGLRDGQQIPHIAVDPRNPNRLFVAVLGHPYGPNAERGIFRSSDGGKTFEKVLYKDENTGGCDVEFDPSNPEIVYATLWEARQGPWENSAWSGTNGGIFKSNDGGKTWRQLTKGLPAVVQATVAPAPSSPNRVYATVATAQGTGIYRSDDGGESWVRATTDARPSGRIGGGDLPWLAIHPTNPDIVWSDSTVAWKSIDGAKTWNAFRGAPGGDDYQRIWVNPRNPDIILMASDQGAVITVNGGATWSSWYNQPTAQMYHVSADNAFPYRVCGGQQESGSACVASRGNDGQVTFREWRPVGVEEYGYVAPDPLNPDIVYGGKVSRYDRRTGQVQNVAPKPLRGADYRVLRTAPVLFSPVDPHTLYFASNTLWKTVDGGRNWRQISPDLTRKTWDVPASVGKYRESATAQPTQRGVIYTVAPSPRDVNRIWAGTDDGLIHVTTNGGLTWNDVTPPQLVAWAKVSILEAGYFDPLTCYAAINTFRLDDLRPHILRTHDGGKTWQEIVRGIPDGAAINAVREDPKRKGLLFAASEREVYVSFDDGENWQSLRLNMPATSIRDVIIKDDDLVVGTHGRGFWILDDITPLRQIDAKVSAAEAHLYKPQTAMRVRWNMNTDTPLPPDEPAGQNPPDGAILNYFLGAQAIGPVTLEILDRTEKLVRKFSSDDPVESIDPATLAVPPYWVRPPRALSAAPGMHRFPWDLHYPPAPRSRVNYPISAIAGNTAPAYTSPWVEPGTYSVRLTAGGKSYTQPLTVKMDPRVKTPLLELQQQFRLSKQLYGGLVESAAALDGLRDLRAHLKKLLEQSAGAAAAPAITAFDKKAEELEGAPAAPFGGGGRGGTTGGPDTINSVRGSLATLLALLQGADVAPTSQAVAAVNEKHKAMQGLLARWEILRSTELAALNAQLKQNNLPPVQLKP